MRGAPSNSPTATSRWSSCAPPRPRRSPAAAGWAAATRTRPTAPRSRRCASCSARVSMDGVVVIGEGEKDEAPMLFNGEQIGDGSPPSMDIAVDPIDGTTLTSLGRAGAIAVIAMSERGTMFDPGPCVYMEKIAAGPAAADVDRPQRAGEGEPRSGRQGARREGQRRHRGDPRPRPPRPTSSASAARPARASGSSPTATSPARSRSRGATPAPTCCSASAARPKA